MYKKKPDVDPMIRYFTTVRVQQGMTQKALADMCPHITLTSLSRFEQGRAVPDLRQLRELMSALSITGIDAALGEIRTRQPKPEEVAALVIRLPKMVRKPLIQLIVAMGRV
ncbi:helix-turn-helix domain-containing protein [Photobacterium sp. Hal280]|uniref:helix-turn-helix domain-containing protein n=1 Tax=Photobacterium sp. Hal280 TaxID=3035163 RepID=UPI00301B7CEB